MRLQPTGEHEPQERPSGGADRSARPSGVMPTAPILGAIALESVPSAGNDMEAAQADRADLVSMTGA